MAEGGTAEADSTTTDTLNLNEKWLKGKGFSSKDIPTLQDLGIGPNATLEDGKAVLNNENLLKVTKRLMLRFLQERQLDISVLRDEAGGIDIQAIIDNPGTPTVGSGVRILQLGPEDPQAPETGNTASGTENIQPGMNQAENVSNNQPPLVSNAELQRQPQHRASAERQISQRQALDRGVSGMGRQTDPYYGRQASSRVNKGGRDETDFGGFDDDQSGMAKLEEVLVTANISEANLKKTCPDEHLDKIALQFSRLEALADALKLRPYQIVEIDSKPGADLAHKLKLVLRTWKDNVGSKATYWRLVVMCMEQFENSKIAEFICRLSKKPVYDEGEALAQGLPRFTPRQIYCACSCFCVCMCLVALGLAFTVFFWPERALPMYDAGPAPVIPHHHEPSAHPTTQAPTAAPTEPPPPTFPPYTGELTGTIIRKHERPTMPQLRSFKLRSKKTIDFVTEIGGQDYRHFGTLLLNSVTDVNIIEASNQMNVKRIVDKILSDWLSGKGKLPVTWDTLINVIRESGLNSLLYDVNGQLHSNERVEL